MHRALGYLREIRIPPPTTTHAITTQVIVWALLMCDIAIPIVISGNPMTSRSSVVMRLNIEKVLPAGGA